MREGRATIPLGIQGSSFGVCFRKIACGLVLGAVILPTAIFGQNSNPAGGVNDPQLELQRKMGAATAVAQKDPAVQAAFQKAMQALRQSDELMYSKIKQIDPSLTEFVDKILKAKYPDLGQGK